MSYLTFILKLNFKSFVLNTALEIGNYKTEGGEYIDFSIRAYV